VAARRKPGRGRRSKAYREFVSEAEEILERMRADLSDLADQRTRSGEAEPELVNRLFRSAHSLKGLAGMFGLDALSELAHHLEDVLDGMRLGRVALDSPAAALLDESVALFAAEMGKLAEPKEEAEDEAEAVTALVARIDSAVRSPESEPPPSALAGLDLDPALLRALTEYEEHRLRENVRRGRRILLVEATFDILAFDEGLAELSAAVREAGELLSTLPSPGAAPESQIRFGLLAASDLDAAALRARMDFPRASVRVVYEPPAAPAAGESLPPVEAVAEAAPLPAPADADRDREPAEPHAGDAAELESLKSISDTVRVDIRKLDELMNLVGELVIQRGALSAIARRLLDDPTTARIGSELDKAHKLLDRKIQELQAGVLEVRMVPLRQVFEKLSRVVRRLRRDLAKEVRLELRGADTELDKLIVEELVDPLMHVVRNAFDHAIESAAERSAAGKPAEGTIRIEASQRGNHVVIEVTDDGRGVDLERVRERAVERGLVASDAELSRRDLLDLVFAPGLSTRDEVTETSGRGVGMDVVKSNLTALGGVVDIDSTPGLGTRVSLTLPITLAIIQALVVGVGDQRYAIPLNSVLETLLVEPGQVQRSEGRELLELRGDPLPLRRLAEEFGLASAPPEKPHVVVIGLGDARLGVVVDQLHGQQDTVIKPVQGPVQNVHGIAGATELGDLGAVLVLDVAALIEDAGRRREAA
jgi:two-component system chemotaxis sensor kinase CheA